MTFLIINYLTKNLFLSFFNILIFLLCNFILINAVLIFFTKNPIFSLLILILNYILITIIFFIFGFQFLAFVYSLVYIGAVSILLIFSLMLLNFKLIFYKTLNKNFFYYIVVFIFFLQLLAFFINYNIDINLLYYYDFNNSINWFDFLFKKQEIFLLGLEIFINYKDVIFLLGIFLFMVLIAAVSIVIGVKDSKKQKLYLQLKKHSFKLFKN